MDTETTGMDSDEEGNNSQEVLGMDVISDVENDLVEKDPLDDVFFFFALWPKDWNSVQSLLQEQGYSDAKEYHICICREEREVRRCGKTCTKYVYSRN